MNTKAERAIELHKKGYNCAQAVACTFCKELGIVTGTKNRLKFNLPKMQGHKALSWINFKRLVIGDKATIKKVLADHGIDKPFFLRTELFKLVESGKATEMYFAKKKGEADGADDDDEEGDDE